MRLIKGGRAFCEKGSLMKLDMSRAWADAVHLLSNNRQVILVVAGVFVFLPYLALALLMPQAMNPMAGAAPGQAQSADAMMAMFTGPAMFALIAVAVLQGVGTIALLALLTDNSRPTVGDALGLGLKALLPYLATLILQGLLVGLVLGIPIGAAFASGNSAAMVVVGLLALVGFLYAYVKFSLTIPVIGIERQMNPVAVLKRSWQLTKGNSVRLLAFYVLLFIAFLVLSMIVSMVIGLPLALMGGGVATFGTALVGALSNTVMVILFMGVLAAVHRQLSGSTAEAMGDVFD